MAVRRNQHFVPQFYLRNFRSAQKRVHLYDLGMMESRKDVGIKGQCYKRYFYGKDNKIEDVLSQLEGTSAKTLQALANTQKLPHRRSKAYRDMLIFVCMQYLRTQKRMRSFQRILYKSVGRAFGNKTDVPEGIVLGRFDLIELSLSMIPSALEQINDLQPHLVVSRSESFITSDAPVYIYNQYCEGIRDRGITGLASRGLQIFMPISPSLLLVLYDGSTYKIPSVADKWTRRSFVDDVSDIDQLNLLQLVSAERNIYFSNWGQHKHIERLLPVFERIRVADPQIVREFQQDDDPKSSLLAMFDQMANLSLDLSFVTISGRADKIPLYGRPNLYRDGRSQLAHVQSRDSDGETITFSRFLGES